MGDTFPLAADDPYCQWVVKNICGASSWLISSDWYKFVPNIDSIANILFWDPKIPDKDPQTASYSELPYSRLFAGGNQAFMRTGWSGDDTIAGLRCAPAYTKSSHGDFDVNTFLLYRKGVLSADTGVYDEGYGYRNHHWYQKNTVSHNNMLVIDPARPNDPGKYPSRQSPDPGGTELVSTRTFSCPDKPWSMRTIFVHNADANWGDIVDYRTTPEYDYAVGESALAYGDRVNEYYRSVVFLRKGTKAYFIVFDRVESSQPHYDKRWLMHFVSEPSVTGSKVSEEIPGHIDTYDGDLTVAENAFGTSAVYVKTLLPGDHQIRRIGGEDYEFYVDSVPPRKFPIADALKAKKAVSMGGGKWEEMGTWRIELSPTERQSRDYFLNVMYIGAPGEVLPSMELIDEGNWSGVLIGDPEISNNRIVFTKTGAPECHLTTENMSEPGKPGKPQHVDD